MAAQQRPRHSKPSIWIHSSLWIFQNHEYLILKTCKWLHSNHLEIVVKQRKDLPQPQIATGCRSAPQVWKFPSQPASECRPNIINQSIRQLICCLINRRQRRQPVNYLIRFYCFNLFWMY